MKSAGHWGAVILWLSLSQQAIACPGCMDFKAISLPRPALSTAPSFTIIRSQGQWVAYWKASAGQVPLVDFEHFSLLIADPGRKNTSGYSVVFRSVQSVGGQVSVDVVDIGPGVNCPTLQSLTHPIAFALIQRTTQPVRFNVQKALTDCGTPTVSVDVPSN